METNEVMEVEAIEVEEADLMPCTEEMPVVAESSGLSTLGGAVLLGGGLLAGGIALVKTCKKKQVGRRIRRKLAALLDPDRRSMKEPVESETSKIAEMTDEEFEDWTKEE